MSVFSHSVVALGEAAFIDAAEEDRVPDGLFWHVTPGGAADLPAGPVLLRHLAIEPQPVDVVDAATGQQPEPELRVTPDAPVLLLPRTPPGAIIGWALIQGDGNLRVAAISGRVAVGGAYVELSARARPPYAVAGHDMAGLVVSGDGAIIESTFFALPTDFPGDVGDIPGDPQVHALPEDTFPGRGYVVPDNPASYKERIAAPAPRRSVPYALTDPDGAWSPDDELRRAEQIARTDDSVNDWLHKAYDALGSEARAVIEGATADAGQPFRVVAAQTAAAALSIGALDPAIARWLGRSGMLPHGVVNAQGFGLLWATVPLHVYTGRLPAGVTVVRNASDDFVYDDRIGANNRYLDLLQEVQTWPPHPEFGPPDVLLAHVPMPYVPGVTPARPVFPTLSPAPAAAGTPGGSGPRWVPDPPRRWEHTIAIGAPPVTAYSLHGPIARGPVAFTRIDPSPASLHSAIDGTDLAAPLVPGWDDSTGASTLTDSQDVSTGEQAQPVIWSVTLSDWVGRWGDAGTAGPLDPPAPPLPSPPNIEAGLARQAPPEGSAPASPGVVHAIFRVPPARLPGALPLQRIVWSVNGVGQPPLSLTGPAPAAGATAIVVRTQFDAAPTTPGQHQQLTIMAHVEDSAANPSDTTTLVVQAGDARPLRPPTVAPHMLVTSRRAADPTVWVALTVRAPGDGAYRFYLASESALRTAAGLGSPAAATRAVRAQQLHANGGATARQASILALTEPVPVKSGTATAILEIPAGTVDVLAVRAVPVTAEIDASGRIVRDGVEAPFSSVEPAFVVVPSDEVPPTPELTLVAEAAPGAATTPVAVTVTVRGVQPAVLNRYAPQPIQARIVEASTAGDPWFWPEIKVVPLAPSAADPTVFTAETTVDVPAWSRAGLAVAVRYPPEDMVVPGVDDVDEPDLSAAGPQGDRIESPWGPVSVPAWIKVEGLQPTISAASDGAGGLRIQVLGLPELAADAPTFRLDVYNTASVPPLSSTTVTATKPEVFLGPGDVGVGQQLLAMLVTPFGKSLAPVDISV